MGCGFRYGRCVESCKYLLVGGYDGESFGMFGRNEIVGLGW